MLSRFQLIPERFGRTDRQTDRQNCYINIARHCAIKKQILNETAAIYMSLVIYKAHMAAVSFKICFCNDFGGLKNQSFWYTSNKP